MSAWLRDFRHAVRQLRKNRGFTAVAALTLALRIGASATMFGVMNSVLLQPPPVRHPMVALRYE